IAYHYDLVQYNVGSVDLAFFISGGWVCWNVYFAASVVRLCLKARQQRGDHRFVDQIPVRVRADAPQAVPHLALTRDLNPQGLAFRSTIAMQPGQAVEVTLPLATRSVTARGEIVHTKSES